MKEVTEHGSKGYVQGCRCDECKAGHATRMATYRARRRQEAALHNGALPAGVEHGASSYANYGCRCVTCKTKHNDRMRAWYQKTKRPQLEL